jgi:hypothetical protein
MKSILLFLAFSFVAQNSLAATQGKLREHKAIVMVQGEDTDAKRLYDLLKVDAVESNGQFRKEYRLTSGSEILFDVVCSWVPLTNLSSCSLTFNAWRHYPVDISIDNSRNYVLLQTADKFMAEKILKNFVHRQDADEVYTSEDKRLRIWAMRNYLGRPINFAVHYDNI